MISGGPQHLTFTSDIRRNTSIAVALEKRKISFSGRPGQDPDRFLRQTEECKNSLGVTEDEILNNLTSVLTGEALEWFRLKHTNFSSFERFAEVFKKQYTVANFQERLQDEIDARVQAKNEPITTFLTKMQILFDKLEPPFDLERQLNVTFKKFNPDYLSHMNRSDFNDFEGFLLKAKEVEFKLLHIKAYKNPQQQQKTLVQQAAYTPEGQKQNNKKPTKNSPKNEKNEQNCSIESTAAAKDGNNQKSKKQQTKKPPSKTQEAQEGRKQSFPKKNITLDASLEDIPPPDHCFKCRQQGHFFKDCPNEGLK